MKYLLSLLISLAFTASASATPEQVLIEAHYRGLQSVWMADIFSPADAKTYTKDFRAPRVTTWTDQRAEVVVVREIPIVATSSHKAAVNCGITLEVTPTIVHGKLVLSGKSTVRRLVHPGTTQPLRATTFVSEETYFSGTVANGEPTRIKIGDPDTQGEIALSATVVKPAGKLASR